MTKNEKAKQNVQNESGFSGPTECRMCQNPIPLNEIGKIKTCGNCGADLSRLMRKSTPPPQSTGWSFFGGSFPRQAALFSILAPVFSIVVNLLGHQAVRGNRGGMLLLGSVCVFFILTGFVLAVVALMGVRKHGKEGIFGKAIAGVCINGLLLAFVAISIPTYQKAAVRAKAARQRGSTAWDYKSARYGISISLPDSGWTKQESSLAGVISFAKLGSGMRAEVVVVPCESRSAFQEMTERMKLDMDSAPGFSLRSPDSGKTAWGNRFQYNHGMRENQNEPSGTYVGRSLIWIEPENVVVQANFQGKATTVQNPDALETVARFICLSIRPDQPPGKS